MSHMIQLAAMVPPTNMAKQKPAEADHHAGFGALGDAEDDRGEEREEQYGAEMGDGHERFLPVASEWASTAEMMLSSPATTMNLVP